MKKEFFKIAVIDDNDSDFFAEFLNDNLNAPGRHHHFSAHSFDDPTDFLQTLDEEKSTNPTRLIISDLVFLDTRFHDFLTQLRLRHKPIPIIVVSGYRYQPSPDSYTPGNPKIIATYEKPLSFDSFSQSLLADINSIIKTTPC